MTDKEIIKALECCSNAEPCENCPFQKQCDETDLAEIALDLINRQQAEIERLTTLSELGQMRADDYRVMRDRALKAEAEVERLKKENNQFADLGKMYSEIKAEAIKEFAERLCDDRVSNDPVVIAVKVELKEMVGENGKV